MAERGATLVGVLITGFAVGPAETNCYLVAPRAGAAAIVIDPGDEAVPTLEYYFAVNDLTPAAVLLTHGHPTHTASAFDVCEGWDVPAYLHPADRDLLDDPPDAGPCDVTTASAWRSPTSSSPSTTPRATHAGSVVYRVTADTDEGPAEVAFTGDTLGFRWIGRGDDRRGPLGAASVRSAENCWCSATTPWYYRVTAPRPPSAANAASTRICKDLTQ